MVFSNSITISDNNTRSKELLLFAHHQIRSSTRLKSTRLATLHQTYQLRQQTDWR